MSAMMSTNSRERAKAAQFGRIAALIGGWLPGLISPFLGISDGAGFDRKWFFLIIAVVFGFGGMAVSLFATATKERVPVPKEKQTHPFSSFSLLFKNKIVVLIVFSSLLGNITLFLQQITFFEYMMPNNKIFGIQLDGLTLSFIYGLCVGLPGSLTKPFALWTARRLGGMKNILIVSAVFNIGFRVVAFAIGYEGWRIVLSGLFIAFIGIPSQMTDIATTAIWGESLDYTEWRTGKRNEATVFAMQNASSKLSGAISTLFLGVTLRLLKFGAPYPLAVNEIFKKYAWLLFILTPAAGSLLHLIPLLFIHYDDKMKDVIEADLKYLRTLRKGGNVTIDFEYYYELYDDDEESTFNTIRW
jgi:melibiose permease